MRSERTPGPWTASWSLAGVWCVTLGKYPGALFHTFTLPQEREADARLVSAAPDLFDALRVIVHEFGCGRTPLASDISAARDALAKAQA